MGMRMRMVRVRARRSGMRRRRRRRAIGVHPLCMRSRVVAVLVGSSRGSRRVGVFVMPVIISTRRCCCRSCYTWRGRSRRQGRRDGRRRHNSPAKAGDGGGRIAHIGRTLGPHHRDVACIVRAVISGRRAGLRRGGQGCSSGGRGTQRSCDGTVRDAFCSIAVRGDGVGGRRSHRWPTDGTGGRRPLFGRLDQEVQSTAVHALCPATGRNSAQRWHACNRSGASWT